MSSVASVVDGKLVYNQTETTEVGNTNTKGASGSLDKDAFLQLLVAQMKYQDPMEPTDNTEYISQFTAFSQLESMQNMSASMDLQRASGLVGQYVLMNTTNETTGEPISTMGKVDYVFYEGSKAYLNIGGDDFSLDDLDTVIDSKYYNATNLATSFRESYSKLPSIENLTTGYKDIIQNLREVYDNMDSYEKSFVSEDYNTGLKAYEERLAVLEKQEAANKEKNGDDSDNADKGNSEA